MDTQSLLEEEARLERVLRGHISSMVLILEEMGRIRTEIRGNLEKKKSD